MPATDSPGACRIATLHLSRYADVAQALNDPRLVLPGQQGADPSAHLAVRAAAKQALSPARLAAWREAFAADARVRVDALPDGVPVDLVGSLAEPWALDVARVVTGVPRAAAAACQALARRVFLAAAEATEGVAGADAQAAAVVLAQQLAAVPARPGGIADVQTFVALSQSLPALLAGAWLVLLQHPAALAELIAHPQAVARCVGELLRLGSPARSVFREAGEDLAIGQTRLRRGQRVALLLWAANRDPARFADPERLDLARDTAGHLSLGTGLHRCAGAALVRLAVIVATEALLARSATLALVDDAASAVAWRGGFALRAPAALPVLRLRLAG